MPFGIAPVAYAIFDLFVSNLSLSDFLNQF